MTLQIRRGGANRRHRVGLRNLLRMRSGTPAPAETRSQSLRRQPMTIWLAMKRLNRRFDLWTARAAEAAVADLDRVEPNPPEVPRRLIGLRDLLSRTPKAK